MPKNLYASLALMTWLCVFATPVWAQSFLPEDKNKFVILAYSRIGEDRLPDQSLTKQQFDEHVNEILSGNYHVTSLEKALDALNSDSGLPENTIVLTFDGAYASAAEYAFPKLTKARIPFTVFYAGSTLDRKDAEFTDWATLKKLAANNTVTLASLPAVYDHTAYADKVEILKNINRARQYHREYFKRETDFLSYPYGEYSTELQEIARTQGFKAAVGMHSGVVHAGTDHFALPRFSMTEHFGSIDRFRMAARALPLPFSELEPKDMKLGDSKFKAGFTLPESLKNPISCYVDGKQDQNLERLGQRVEIRPEDDYLNETRIRMNCTMQGPKNDDDQETWRWLGLLFHRAPLETEVNTPQQDEPLPPLE